MKVQGISPRGWMAVLCLSATALSACSSEEPSKRAVDPEPSQDAFFDTTRRIEFEIELDAADWEALKNEGRSLSTLFSVNGPYEYTEFNASVTIDGKRFEDVQVRKKGFLASLSALRPSLKLDLDGVVEDQNYLGLKSITLNNGRQDPSRTHECMAYRLFDRAGVPASRCSLAHVVVNGEDLGTYSNVEPINKPYIERRFSDQSGNLYEGQVADFVEGRVEDLQLKTNKKQNDRSDLLALTAALKADDDHLVAELSAHVDLEQFRDFWAMETLLGHWDGYSGNSNNFFVYRNPSTRRFVFLPWGVDSAFEGVNPFMAVNHSPVVYATGLIANRLYKIAAERDRYRARLGELSERLWDVDTLLAEVDRVEALAPDAAPSRLAVQRSLIRAHAKRVKDALEQPAPEWQDGAGVMPNPCLGMISQVTGKFDTVFGDLQDLQPGASELTLALDGEELTLPWAASAGLAEDGSPDPRIRYATVSANGSMLIIELLIPASQFNPGHRLMHAVETAGILLLVGQDGSSLMGFIGDGSIDITDAALEPGAHVAGSIGGNVIQFSCAGLSSH